MPSSIISSVLQKELPGSHGGWAGGEPEWSWDPSSGATAMLQERDCEHRQKAPCEMRGRSIGISYMESVREREKSRKLPRFLDQNMANDNFIYQDIKNKCRRFERLKNTVVWLFLKKVLKEVSYRK